jgi:hypothetical protein
LLQTVETFRHEALLYAGEVDFLTGTLPFIREGMAAGEPVLVVVSAAKIGLLRSALGCGRSARGIGEPIHLGRAHP